ncbi:two-component sensor histidine kinase [Nocardioides gansuensis]|uniref:histidine kinase n=1 Tax=Nocardioides gansuensis TaxID=2138300 RepID=A0A2T8FFE3_9ACTN|nr:ATP-binding protein [Nocardioides gansuensis]PVG84419.1 two-component sensor histidine kinase [Nocardioides gansuensis]
MLHRPAVADRHLTAGAALVAVVAVACCAVVPAVQAGLGDRVAQQAGLPSDLVLGTVWPVVGALVVRARPRNPVGWLLMVPALIGPYQLCALYAAWQGGTGLLGGFAAWVAIWGFAPYFFTLPVLPHVFPDGHTLGPRWRRVLVAVVAVAVVTTVARMFAPVTADIAPALDNPLALPGGDWLNYVTAAGAMSLFFVGIPVAVVSLAVRMRRARGVERTQLQWLLLGGIVLAVGALPVLPAEWGLSVGLFGLPVAIGIAMLRHGLFDVELTLNRALVFGVLTGVVVAAYALAVYGIQAIAPDSRWGLVLVATAALLAAAARDRVQAVVDRLLYGHRHDPYAVITRVGRHMAAAGQPTEALERLVDGLREALRLPYVAFTGGDLDIASGTPTHGTRTVPARALGEAVGELHVGLRRTGEAWSPPEQAAIEEVAARAGTLAYAAGLVADVARSRERIVLAREEERRRIRADLHDSVAPALAGSALQLDSLVRRLRSDQRDDLADRAATLRDGLRETVAGLRSLAHDLRPPVLDQRGLTGALRELVAGHDAPRCEADIDELGTPPAAIEVTAYAIAAEAFSNALRHSAASRIRVTARARDGWLELAVVDNGVGLPASFRAGVGTVSMRERAVEVGGRLEMAAPPGGGTTVTAALPLEVA